VSRRDRGVDLGAGGGGERLDCLTCCRVYRGDGHGPIILGYRALIHRTMCDR